MILVLMPSVYVGPNACLYLAVDRGIGIRVVPNNPDTLVFCIHRCVSYSLPCSAPLHPPFDAVFPSIVNGYLY